MKFRSITLAVSLAISGAAGLLASGAALAQEKVQFFPVLSGRTGPVAPNATPWANGHNDYMKLVNARGGINGVMTLVEECETAYATDRGVECYERLKGKHGGATVFQPLSTGITFALTDKVPADKIPLITSGYGRSDTADGNAFKWNFPLVGHYWVAGDTVLQHIAKKEGGWDKLKGKKIAVVYHDSPFGKELLPIVTGALQDARLRTPAAARAGTGRGAEVHLAAGAPAASGLRRHADLGRDDAHRDQGSRGHGLPAREDVRHLVVGRRARPEGRGRRRQGLQRRDDAARRRAGLASRQGDPREGARQGPGHGPEGRSRQVLYMRGAMGAMLAVEGVARAGALRQGQGHDRRAGPLGLREPEPDQAKLDALGFKGVMRPVSTSCADHLGASWARVHTWDGSKLVFSSDWLQADEQIIKPLVKASAEKYAGREEADRRTPADCQS
jgi:branched-chain amino acid transport system substrate-binding protein